MHQGLLALALAASIVGASPVVAFAQASSSAADTPRERARAHAAEGARALEGGRWAEAIQLFQRADQLYPTPNYKYYEAQAHARAGDLRAAAASYEAAAQPLSPDAPDAWKAAQAEAASELAALQPPVAPASVPEASAPPPPPPAPALVPVAAPPPPEAPGPATDALSHAGQWGVFARADVEVLHGGALAALGASWGALPSVDVQVGALLGRDKGVEPAIQVHALEGAWKPYIHLAAPVFFTGGAWAGGRASAGLQWDPSRKLGLFVAMGAAYFPSVPDGYGAVAIVPAAGVSGRL